MSYLLNGILEEQSLTCLFVNIFLDTGFNHIILVTCCLFCQDFYLELRKQHQTRDSTPITTRQLESLIRLTEARARLELREEATKHDAEDVIQIMKYRSVLL